MNRKDLCIEIASLLGFTLIEVPADGPASGITPDRSARIDIPPWTESSAHAGVLIEIAARRGLRIALDSDERNATYSCHFEPVGWIENHMYGFDPDMPISVINNYLRRSTFPEAVANAMYIALCTRSGIEPKLTAFLEIGNL